MRSGGSLLSFVLLGFGLFFLVHASDVGLTCYDGKALSFVQCNPGELCYNNTFAFIPGDDYSCKTKDYCDSHNYTADSCTSSIELHGCCCDFDYCNDPRDAPTTIPTPPSGQTWPPPLTCFDGVTQGFIQCQPWQVCYNNSLALIPGDDWGCRSRDYCASHNLTLDGCSSWLTLHGCCCDFDYCNDPADAPKTTTPIPTPPSGQTWGPGLKCFDGVSYSFITCQPWELCYNNSLALLPGDDWGCRSIDYCSQHNLTVDSCQSALTLHGCCCDFDYCNDPRDAPTPTTPVPTPPSGQTWPPNLVCYQDGDYGDGQWVTCKPGEVCYNSSLLADGCKSRDFCANNNLTIDGCESLGLLHGCCCDFNYCNNPGHGPTTAPTPPSGGTWPPPLWCYSNVGDDYDDPGFVQCKPWEICYNASSLIIFEDYGCVTRDWCASHNATSQDGSGGLGCGHQGLGTDCCCDTDWCNNPREAPPFPSTSPKPTGPTTPPLTACPAGWTESNSQSQKCYIVPGTSDTYTAAVQACKQLYGSSLAVSIANGFENSEIRDMAGRDTLWIGLEKKSSDWAWSDGSTQTYRNWATGEPAATGSCSTLTVGDGKWRAQDCSQSFPIVCELTY